MSRSRIYTVGILLDDLEGAELGTGDVLTFAPAATVPLMAGHRIVDTAEYLEVMTALNGDRIVAAPSSRGALVALKNAWLRAHGVRAVAPPLGVLQPCGRRSRCLQTPRPCCRPSPPATRSLTHERPDEGTDHPSRHPCRRPGPHRPAPRPSSRRRELGGAPRRTPTGTTPTPTGHGRRDCGPASLIWLRPAVTPRDAVARMFREADGERQAASEYVGGRRAVVVSEMTPVQLQAALGAQLRRLSGASGDTDRTLDVTVEPPIPSAVALEARGPTREGSEGPHVRSETHSGKHGAPPCHDPGSPTSSPALIPAARPARSRRDRLASGASHATTGCDVRCGARLHGDRHLEMSSKTVPPGTISGTIGKPPV